LRAPVAWIAAMTFSSPIHASVVGSACPAPLIPNFCFGMIQGNAAFTRSTGRSINGVPQSETKLSKSTRPLAANEIDVLSGFAFVG
jgi:hypothetical protein